MHYELKTASPSFWPTMDHLLDLYNDIADGKTVAADLADLLDTLRQHRNLFLPYIDTDLVEQQLLSLTA